MRNLAGARCSTASVATASPTGSLWTASEPERARIDGEENMFLLARA
jgi:hypothetical protein